MSSGLNPAGTLCLGAINTSIILIGNAIKIDNTTATAEITIDDEAYIGTGTQTNFTALIPSKAGLNPTGTLHIGTSNTSEVIMGSLKIDNTVVPPQIYINEIALAPSGLAATNSDKFTLQGDVTGNYSTINGDLIFIANVDNIANVSVADSGLNKLSFASLNHGIYQITIKIKINNEVTRNGETQNIFLRALPMPESGAGFTGFYNFDDLTIQTSENAPIANSNIEFTFDDSSSTLEQEITFTVGVLNQAETSAPSSASFTIGSGSSDPISIKKIGTEITINRIGDLPLP
jgi:hypothetical protein